MMPSQEILLYAVGLSMFWASSSRRLVAHQAVQKTFSTHDDINILKFDRFVSLQSIVLSQRELATLVNMSTRVPSVHDR